MRRPYKMDEKNKLNEKELDEVLKQIQKQFGKGAVMKLGDRPNVEVSVIPSGSLLLDEALGVGGYPKGRIIEIYGPNVKNKGEELLLLMLNTLLTLNTLKI